jgi:nicotinamide-nucleotide amidase
MMREVSAEFIRRIPPAELGLALGKQDAKHEENGMNAEIISVGTELLLGQIVDTNAAFLARTLARLGIGVYQKSVVGDNAGRIGDAIRLALSRTDIVVLGGGLGPTKDDLTKETAAEVLGIPLVNDAQAERRLRDFFERRDIPLPPTNLKQALVFDGGVVFQNDYGTAPGVAVEKDGKIVVCLPGPPGELPPMVEHDLVPYLQDRMGPEHPVLVSRVLKVVGMGESSAAEKIDDLLDNENPTVAPYAKTGEVHLRVTARAKNEDEANAMIDPVDHDITARLGNCVFGRDDETLEGVIVARLRALGWTLGGAESCTAGRVSDRIAGIPGCSDVFMGAAVTYSNQAKQDLLGVSAETLKTVGAVSEETAREMAAGARAAFHTDVGYSITGIAGPGGGTEEKPVGTVYIAVETPHAAKVEMRLFMGGRDAVRGGATQAVLNLLRTMLGENMVEQ